MVKSSSSIPTRLLLVLVAAALSTPIQAGMLGTTVNWQGYFMGGPTGAGTYGSFTADGTIGGLYRINGAEGQIVFGIAVDDNTVTLDYSVNTWGFLFWNPSPLSLAPTIYNGIALDFPGTLITSVTLNPATNMVGFDASRFSYTSNQIQVDWMNLAFVAETIVKFDVTTSEVPEPTSALTCLSAVLALWRMRRRDGARHGGSCQ